MTIRGNQKVITELLLSTKREGIENMIDYLIKEGFFESPASTKFHGSYAGGLAEHSLKAYNCLINLPFNILTLAEDTMAGKKPLPITPHGVVIACLLHDVCKLGAYIPVRDGKVPYRWNKAQPKGHAQLSIERIKKHIELEPVEAIMILYHMGIWGLHEFYEEGSWQSGEYPLRGDHSKDEHLTKEESQKARYGKSMVNAVYHNPIVFWMHVSDMIATTQEKLEEAKGE
jgi:hypothetical protein